MWETTVGVYCVGDYCSHLLCGRLLWLFIVWETTVVVYCVGNYCSCLLCGAKVHVKCCAIATTKKRVAYVELYHCRGIGLWHNQGAAVAAAAIGKVLQNRC